MKRALRFGLLLTTCLAIVSPAAAGPVDSRYPSLDEKELGQVRHLVDLARQADGDWSGMQIGNRSAFDGYQFQIAWMYYALAVAQSQQTPAYRELYKASSEDLIRKMVRNDVWSLWGAIIEHPLFKKYLEPGKDFRDPVADMNIMYSGHILQMIGLYEVLYRDHRYDDPKAITFSMAGESPFTHHYSHKDLAELIHRQFVENSFNGIECEPNLVFAECNQHPVMGLINYDQVHGAKLSDIKGAFWDKAMSLGFIEKESKRFVGPYRMKEEAITPMMSGWNDGWSGVTLHGWNKDLVKQVYPAQRDASLSDLLNTDPQSFKNRWNQGSVSSDFGFLAAYAAEVGDEATSKRMLAFADQHFGPTWQGTRYVYPTNDVQVPGGAVRITGTEEVPGTGSRVPPKPLGDEQLGQYQVGPLNANALLAFARLNPGEGLWKINNDLASTYVVKGPEVIGVEYPKVLVNQAYYDESRGVLAVGLTPGADYKGSISFRIRNLPRRAAYEVTVDGVPAAVVSAGKINAKSADAALAWTSGGELRVELPLRDGRNIQLKRISQTVASR